jgi:hypothetical protein
MWERSSLLSDLAAGQALVAVWLETGSASTLIRNVPP